MLPDEIAALIRTALPDATVQVVSDDNTHFEALIVAAEFAGKRPIARHQMVYASLGDRMGGEIHALSIRALTPDEWQAQSASQ
ncbi:MAG: BolA/IbaG family iron-sulfur metabolism protein [Pseudomonadota bacterium]